MSFITIQGRRLEYEFVETRPGAPVLVFLHEGLGSISLWKDFPAQAAAATGCNALVYSRYGYGQSDVFDAPLGLSFMHDEALKALPELLDKLDIHRPILVGHSDGGSIALIHAAAERPVAALVLLAPHVRVEDLTLRSIAAAKKTYEETDLPARLGRHHADVDVTFRSWVDAWLTPSFSQWNIESLLKDIRCPVLAIQGEEDEYGTMAQIDRIQEEVSDVRLLKLANCRHSAHRDQTDAVLAAMKAFIAEKCR